MLCYVTLRLKPFINWNTALNLRNILKTVTPNKIFCCFIRSAPLGSPAPISSLAATNDQDSKKENKAEDPRTKVRLTFTKYFYDCVNY